MIHHIWTVLCKKTITDKDSNNISLYEILERLEINTIVSKEQINKIKMVNVPIEYEIVSLWNRNSQNNKEKYIIQLEILDPDKKSIKTFDQDMILSEGFKRYRSIFKIKGFSASKEGEYSFVIKIKKENNTNFETQTIIPLEVSLKIHTKEMVQNSNEA